MFEGLKKTVYLVVPLLGLFGVSFGAKVAPLYFESLGNSAGENATTQQEYWEGLMKYKLWGSEGLTFNKHTVHIADKNGYNGTAIGDISFFNGAHHVGGPLLSGKGLHLSDDGTTPNNDTLSGGPVRVLGDFAIADWAANSGPVPGAFYDGPYCIQGAIKTRTSQMYDNTLTNWAAMVKGGVYASSGVVAADASTADSSYTYNVTDPETGDLVPVTEYYKYVAYPFAVGTYQSCPVEVPPVDTHLRVPIWPEPAEWAPGINMSDGVDQVAYIHVPPESAYINEYGTYDLYIEDIYMHNSAHKYLYVVMPHGGRLTRIFVRDGFNIQPSANSAVIQVVYADREAVFNTATNEWDVAALVDSNYISNAKYAGNLMFYTNQDVHWKSMVKPSYQGTFMTTGKFTIENHFTLAGQLVANNLWFESDIVGDFRYVPFDPPILKIDPEVLQNGAFPENNEDAEIPISLDTVTNTSVDFNYCFDLDLSTAGLVDFQRTATAPLPICEIRDTSWAYTYDEDGVTKLDSAVASIAVTRDSGYVVIPARRLTPYDANKAYLNVFIDGIEEGEEYLHMKIFNLAGAVLPGNEREGHFTLKIIDANNPPVAGASSVTGTEDVTYTFKTEDFAYYSSKDYAETGIIIATLPNKGTLTFNGSAITASRFIPVDSIAFLKYTGKKDDFGTPCVTFQFKVRDEMNSTSGAGIMTVNLNAVNDGPSAVASTYTIAENSAVGTVATGSLVVTDVDDTEFAYTLVAGDTSIFQINPTTGKISVKSAVLNFETKESYTVTVHVRDMSSTTTLADTLSYNVVVTINVTDVNEKPTVADAEFTVPEKSAAGTTVGTVTASDPDTKNASYGTLYYSLADSTAGAASLFDIDENGKITVAQGANLDYEADSIYYVKVIVTDKTYSDTATVKITLTDVNEPPYFENKTPNFTVNENVPAGTKVGVVTAKDVDGTESLAYSIVDPTGTFVVNASNGTITVKSNNSIDYEAKDLYIVKVIVTDKGGFKDTAEVTITVNDVNEKPDVKDAQFAVDENSGAGTTVGFVEASDPDTLNPAFGTLYYSLADSTAGAASLFNINGSGKITVAQGAVLDYETKSVYYVKVIVTDKALSDTATVKITLNDKNEPPHFADDTPSFTVNENVPAGTSVGFVTATDVDGVESLKYTIIDETGTFVVNTTTGEITVKADDTIDFETKSSYTVKVVVTDKDGLKDTATVTIKVNDVNEKPTVEDSEFHVAENSRAGTEVGKVVASDPDVLNPAFGTLYYSLADSTAGAASLFDIDENGKITVAQGANLDFETDSVFFVKAIVTDGTLSDTALVKISLIDTPEPPKFDDDTPTLTVDENVPAGTSVGFVTATDVDDDDTLTYSIKDPTDTFIIDEVTGEITVKADSTIDYEKKNEYTVTVVVTDKYGYTDTATVTIKVNDLNETPDIPDQTLTFSEDDPVGTTKVVVATDPDTAKAFSTLTYELVGESEQFEVKEDGTVELKKELDYEADSVFTIKVRVTDGELSDTALVTIKIGNIPEHSEVEITRAETRDTVVLNPDTLFVNTPDVCIEWKADGKLRGPDCDLELHEGENIIVREFQDPTKDFPGADTLVIYFSTATPVVTVTKAVDEAAWASIFTVIEEQATNDPTFYVNDPKNDIKVTVTDTVTGSKESFTVKVELDTVKVPEKTFTGTLSGIVDAGLTLNENPASGVTYTPVNGDTVVVSYKEVVNGKEVVVSYKTDTKGNVLEGEDGVKVITVTYTTEVNGHEVRISYEADAVTGEVVHSAGSFASAALESSGSDKSESGKSGKDGKDGDKDSKSGKDEKAVDAAVFMVTYDYVDPDGNVMTVSYGVDEKGVIVRNGDGNIGYEVSYTYTNKYGNSATRSLFIVLDEVAPVVEILSPAEGDVVYSNFVDVKWTVDMGDGRGAIVQDTLITQGLEKGANAIVRFYRDKAGNEASDTVIVIMKNAKDVDITIEQPVTVVTREKTEEYYASHEPEEGETFAISIYNTKADREVETQVGGSFKTKPGSEEEPYPGLTGHLGPTLGIDAKVPIVTATGGLATFDDLIAKDGMVPLQGVDSKDSKKISVEEYVEQYCDDEFAEKLGSDFSKANLYKNRMYVNIWIYTSLGQFVDYYSFTQDLDNPDYVNDAGLLTMYFEMKPDRDGNVRSKSGRLYATGAYVFKTEVELKSTLRCTVPPIEEGVAIPEAQKKGAVRTVKEDLLKSFGYKRPKSE